MKFEFEPIGVIRTVFKEKFGIPRQPGLVKSATGSIRIEGARLVSALKGLDQFSHIWLIWVFHQTGAEKWKPTIRPPRLGGAKKMGVLATRSPHRPNPIGLSVVKLDRVEVMGPNSAELRVSGVDLLDLTPILDIKPYIAYADCIRGARSGFAENRIQRKKIQFTAEARKQMNAIEKSKHGFASLVKEFLSLDPRPAFQQRKSKEGDRFGVWVSEHDVQFTVVKDAFKVHAILNQRAKIR